MIPFLNHIFILLRLVIVPVLIIVILALIIILVGLLRKLQQHRSLQQSPQYHPGATSMNPDQLQRLRSLQQSPQAAYPHPTYTPAEPERREAVVRPSSQSDTSEPSSPPRPIPTHHDDPLNDKRWLKLVEECVGLFDNLDRHFASFDPARQELVEHVLLQLQEILERSDVELIAGDATFERRRHQPEQPDARAAPGTPIIETLSPGFAVGNRVLRRARVRLAEIPS